MWWEIDTENIGERARTFTRREIFALIVGVEIIVLWFYMARYRGADNVGIDFYIYLYGVEDDFGGFSSYLPYYWLPILDVLKAVGAYYNHAIWSFANLIGLLFATRVFNGKLLWIVVNGITILTLGEGQITGLTLAGLAMVWWGVHAQHLNVAGIGGLLLASKYHYGGILALYLWLHPDLSWKQRLQILVIPGIIMMISFIIYGFWIRDIFETISSNSPNDNSSVTLWQWIGPFCLFFWLPVIFLRLSYQRRFQLIIVTCMLALPYLQYHDMNMMFLYTDKLGMSSFIAVGSAFLFNDFSYAVIVPFTVYLLMVGGEIQRMYTLRYQET